MTPERDQRKVLAKSSQSATIQPGASFRTRQCDTIRSKVNCGACHDEAEVDAALAEAAAAKPFAWRSGPAGGGVHVVVAGGFRYDRAYADRFGGYAQANGYPIEIVATDDKRIQLVRIGPRLPEEATTD